MEHNLMLIDGAWIDSESGEYIHVENPATEEAFSRVPKATNRQVENALEAAERAFRGWARLSPAQRGAYLWDASHTLGNRIEDIGRTLTCEQGKPLKEAIGEIQRAIELLRYYAEEAKRAQSEFVPRLGPSDQSSLIRQPVGVVAAISPWNYPVQLMAAKVAPALATGCTVVVKPPSLTPLSPLGFCRCLSDSGLPRGVINAVTGTGDRVGRCLVHSPITRKIAFTGSTDAGLDIIAHSATSIKKMSLELGGQCPLVITEKADLDLAVKGAVRRSFRNMGQVCTSINRIYVQESIRDSFLERFVSGTSRLVIGNGLDKDPRDLGPMASRDGLEKTQRHIADALDRGAFLAYGGRRPEGPEFERGYFFEPTILSDVNHDMLVMREETFGPVVGVMAFQSVDEAIQLANDTPYGLAAYVYTDDLNEADRFVGELEAGSVGINNVDVIVVEAPFGGWKQSGVGLEHGRQGLEEYLHLKHVRTHYQNTV